MESSYVSAAFGLAGVSVGGITSFLSMWVTQRQQLREKNRQAERIKLETLFNEFIGEASRLYADALSHEKTTSPTSSASMPWWRA